MTDLTREIRAMAKRYADMLEQVNGRAAVRLAPEVRKIERELKRMLKRGKGRLTAADAVRLRSEMNAAIRASELRAARLVAEFAPSVMKLNAERTQATTLLLLRAVKSPRIGEAFRAMETWNARLQTRMLGAQPFYAERFRASWDDRWTSIVRQIDDQLVDGVLLRRDWRESAHLVANKLERLTETGTVETPSGNLLELEGRPIRGLMHPEAFARGFVRDALNDVYRRESVDEAQALTLTRLVNIGIPDDRQEIECYRACQMGALTIEEWEASDVGRAGRHHGCRCVEIGVPAALVDRDWTQANPELQEAA